MYYENLLSEPPLREKPEKPPKPTKKSKNNYQRSIAPPKPPKPTKKSKNNYQRTRKTQPRNVEMYMGEPIYRESAYNMRGITRKYKENTYRKMAFQERIEREDQERQMEKEKRNQEFREHFFRNGKELNNKEYRTKMRRQIGNNLRRRKEMMMNKPEFNMVNNTVFPQPIEVDDESSNENNFVLVSKKNFRNVPKRNVKKGFLSRITNKISIPRRRSRIRYPTRQRSSVGGGHRINLIEKKSMHKRRNSPIYKGLGSDLIMSYIYLMIKHKQLLTIAIGDKEKLKKNPNPTYIGLVYSYKNNENSLEYDGGMKDLSKFMLNCKTRFFMVPVSMEYPNSGAHFNLLLGDTKTDVLERFEPYGSVINEKVHDNFDKAIQSFLKTHDIDLKYKKPKDFIQQKGFQELEEVQIEDQLGSVRRDDYRGYCGMWSIWFVDMRMKNPNISSKELLALSLKKMKGKNFRRFIRNYTNYLIEMRKVIMEKTDKDCRKNNNGKSPDYDFFKVCVSKFVNEHLDEYF
jgi:hypothetical protein